MVTALPDDHDYRTDDGLSSGLASIRDTFHRGLRAAAARVGDGLKLLATFSDCGDLVVEQPQQVLASARVATRHFRGFSPVRGGIGYGNFGIHKTAYTWNGVAPYAEAIFFGSSLVHAHRAESCGHKGCRILVHESAATALMAINPERHVYQASKPIWRDWDKYDRDLPIPGTVMPMTVSSVPDVAHEVCYIGDDHLEEWLDDLAHLEKQADPNGLASEHYRATREMFERIRHFRETDVGIDADEVARDP